MTKYVAMQRPRRRLSFWQRTLLIFFLALVVMIIVLAFLYSRSFSLVGPEDIATTAPAAQRESSPVAAAGTGGEPSQAGAQAETAADGTTRSTWLFSDTIAADTATNPTNPEGVAGEDARPTTDVTTPVTATATIDAIAVAAINERPELLRDLRLSEQSLAEDEPRVAMELLLGLSRDYPTFRPEEVTERLYQAYLALGDQAMRRETRSEAVGYYDQAGQLAVTDQTGLTRRRAAIARLFPNLQAQPQSQAQPQATATPPGAAVAPAATATPTIAGAAAQNTPAPTPTQTPVPPVFIQVAPSCPDSHIALTAPAVDAVVSGSVAVVGSVRLEELWYYKLEWAAAGSADFAYFGGTERSVENGLLGRLDTTALPNGEYLIRVTVVDQTGNYPPPCEVPVTVAN